MIKKVIGGFFVSIPFIGIACLGVLPEVPWWFGLALLAGAILLSFLIKTGIEWLSE